MSSLTLVGAHLGHGAGLGLIEYLVRVAVILLAIGGTAALVVAARRVVDAIRYGSF